MDRKEMLKAIKDEFWKGYKEKEIVIGNYSFNIKTINYGEEVWRDKFIAASASVAFLSSRKAPTLAVAINGINGQLIEEIFPPEDDSAQDEESKEKVEMIKALLKASGMSSEDSKFQTAIKLLAFLSDLPGQIIDHLYNEWENLQSANTLALSDLVKKK